MTERLCSKFIPYFAIITMAGVLFGCGHNCPKVKPEPLDECHQKQRDMEQFMANHHQSFGDLRVYCPGDSVDTKGTP